VAQGGWLKKGLQRAVMLGTPVAGLLLLPVLVGAAARRPEAARTETNAIFKLLGFD
jgi:hypothetical protein